MVLVPSASAQGGLSCEELKATGLTKVEAQLFASLLGGNLDLGCYDDGSLEDRLEDLADDLDDLSQEVLSSSNARIKSSVSNMYDRMADNNFLNEVIDYTKDEKADMDLYEAALGKVQDSNQMLMFLGFSNDLDLLIKRLLASRLDQAVELMDDFIDSAGGSTNPPPVPTNGTLQISESSNNPNSSTILVEENNTSDTYGIFTFNLENDTGNIVDLGYMQVVINTDDSDPRDVIAETWLEINGRDFEGSHDRQINDEVAIYDFGVDYRIGANDDVDISLLVEFESQLGNYESGQEIYAEIMPENISVKVPVKGYAESETHNLAIAGLTLVDWDSISWLSDHDGANNDVVLADIEVELSAFEEDVYLLNDTNPFDLYFENKNGASKNLGDDKYRLVSTTASKDGLYYVIKEGQTESFRLNGELKPNQNGSYRFVLGEHVDYYLQPGQSKSVTSIGKDLKSRFISVNDINLLPSEPKLTATTQPYGQDGTSVGVTLDWNDVAGASSYLVTTNRRDYYGSATTTNRVYQSILSTGTKPNAGESRGYCYEFEFRIQALDSSGRVISVKNQKGNVVNEVTKYTCVMATPGQVGTSPSKGQVQGATSANDAQAAPLKDVLDILNKLKNR